MSACDPVGAEKLAWDMPRHHAEPPSGGASRQSRRSSTSQKILLWFRLRHTVSTMGVMRAPLVSWFVFLCLALPVGAQMHTAPLPHLTIDETTLAGTHSGDDLALARTKRVGTREMARNMSPLVPLASDRERLRVSVAPPLTGPVMTAFLRGHTLRIHQRISVYRI